MAFPVEVLKVFRPGQSSSSSSYRPAGISEDTDEPGDGFFRTFPRGKKVRRLPGRSVRTCPGTSAHGPRRLVCSQGGSMSKTRRRRRRRSVWRRTAKLQRLWNERVSSWRVRGGRGRRGSPRRTPRTSSHSSRSRARLRQRQWHTPGWFYTVHAVFPSFFDRPKMLGFFWLAWTRRTGMLRG